MSMNSQKKASRRRASRHSELSQLTSALEEMRQEFKAQKQELEQKIIRLERELSQTRQLAHTQSYPEERTTRRRMLKKLGIAAVGLAASGVALTAGQNPPVAEAAPFSLQINDGSVPSTNLPPTTYTGLAQAAGGTTWLTTPATGTAFNTFGIDNRFTSGTNADALVVSSNSGVALNAQSLSGNSAVLGVQNVNTGITSDVSANNPGISTTAGITGSSDNANGVTGLSRNRYGIFGFASGNGGYGGVFQVATTGASPQIAGSAPLLIVPEPQAGPPAVTGITHQKGELHVDSNGDLWLCTALGTSGGVAISSSEITRRFPGLSSNDRQRLLVGAQPSWVKVNGAAGTVTFLTAPIRILGPYNTTYPNYVQVSSTPSSFPIEGTWTNANPAPYGTQTGSIPSVATSVLATISVITPSQNGYLTVWPADVGQPIALTMGYTTGNFVVSTSLVLRLGIIPTGPNAGKKGITIYAQTPCAITLDISGYYT